MNFSGLLKIRNTLSIQWNFISGHARERFISFETGEWFYETTKRTRDNKYSEAEENSKKKKNQK